MSKAFDMQFYWIGDKIFLKQFNIYWQNGDSQKRDYHSKHHFPSHHRKVRPIYLHFPQRQHIIHLQVCVNSALGALDVHAIKTGALGACRQITQFSRCVYSRCKVQTTGHPIFHKYSHYENNNKGD